jgi:phosphohistidine phosphatase
MMAERRLVLIRHAKSDYPPGVIDHERPLNERGRRDAPAIGRWLSEHIDPSTDACAVISSAERTQQTWAAAIECIDTPRRPRQVIDERIYEASPATLREVVLDHADADTVVLVGHSPGLPLLVAELGRPGDAREEALEKFPTSAIAVLTTALPWSDAMRGIGAFDVSSFVIPRG